LNRALLGLLLLGCSAAAPADPPPGPSGTGGSGGSGGAPAELPNPLGRLRCHAPAGTTGSPSTIEEAVALLNALPKPTSVACFVESLDRPLTVFSTNSPFSAQPALSNRSPRMFIKSRDLWLSIVIDGQSSDLVEFGHLLPGTLRSIKAELHLPLQVPAAPGDPYQRVMFGDQGTSCGLCHFDEVAENVPGIANVFSSVAFRPRPDTRVNTETLRVDSQTCNWQVEPHRCDMLSAVFNGGPVLDGAFPEDMLTFF
jgi:hypothetical protein